MRERIEQLEIRTQRNERKLEQIEHALSRLQLQLGKLNLREPARFDITSHVTPGTEFSVDHNMGRIPDNFIVINQDGAGTVYKDSGGTAWTRSIAYFKSDVASITFTLTFI